MTAPATDIITRLIDYAGHDDCPGRFYKESWDGIVCTCGYSAVIADAREFLEGERVMTSEIKPCPFCGTSMVVVTKDMFSHPGTLGDHRCLLAGKSYYWEHINWWNTRQSTADLQAKLDKAVEALEWYQEKTEGCRKITRDGDNARHALDADYGRRAKAVITLITVKPESDE